MLSSQTMNYTAPVLGGVLLVAIGWYYFPVWGGKYWFEGPRRNLEVAEEGVAVGDSVAVEGERSGKGHGGEFEVREVVG